MDSFYGAPRQPPTLPSINPIERIPLVPEVSVIDNSSFPTFKPTGCNANIRHPQMFDNSLSKESFINLKKHVRFKSFQPEPVSSILGKENIPQTINTMPDLNGKTFKQIYMANVPDRHLDLSIFESPRQNNGVGVNCDKQLGKQCDSYDRNNIIHSTRQRTRSTEDKHDYMQLNTQCDNFKTNKPQNVAPTMCNTQSNDIARMKSIENVTSSLSWRDRGQHLFNTRHLEDRLNQKDKPHYTEICIQTEPPPNEEKCTDIATPSDEPTLKDLFQLIQRQNEQIMHLQQQVNSLKTNRHPELGSVPHEAHPEKPFIKDLNSPSKKNLFSFGVKATSVEFSFRAPHKFRRNEFLEPKIQEVVDSTTYNHSTSLHLDESIELENMRNSCVSNVQNIAIEMNAYQGSDDEETTSEEEDIGLTLYNGLMNQVKNALQKNSECQLARGSNTRQAMTVVKQATLQHLNSIGINLTPIQESSEVTGNTDIEDDQTDVSCAVQQLLMKYLPSDKLAKVVNKPKEPVLKSKGKKLKPSNTEFSFATLQYMKKYNLIDNTRNVDSGKNLSSDPKVLDVTALKLQPKLL